MPGILRVIRHSWPAYVRSLVIASFAVRWLLARLPDEIRAHVERRAGS